MGPGLQPLFVLTDDIDVVLCLGGETVPNLRFGEVATFDGIALSVRWPDGASTCLGHPNMGCLGLIACKAASPELKDWWYERSGIELATLHLPASTHQLDRRAALLGWLADRVLSALQLIRLTNQDLLAETVQLRRSYAAVQSSFRQLESFVVANNFQLPVLQHDAADIGSFWPPQGADKRSLLQLLPVLSDKFSSVEFYLKPADTPGEGVLTVRLALQPSDRTLGHFEIKYDRIVEGWYKFTPPPVVGELNEVTAELAWSTADGAPSIGFSEPHWNTPYAVAGADESQRRPRSLAMRIWGGLPGVRAASSASHFVSPSERPRGIFALEPAALLGSTQHSYARTVQRDYPSVNVDVKLGLITTHPHGDIPTIAKIPHALHHATTYVSAVATTRHEQGPVLEYAFAVVRPDLPPETVFCGNAELADGFSGWRRVPAKTPTRLSLVLQSPLSPGAELYLATRLAPGSVENFAWATWSGFEIGINWRPPAQAAKIVREPAMGTEAQRAETLAERETGARMPELPAQMQRVIDQQRKRRIALPAATLSCAKQHKYALVVEREIPSVRLDGDSGRLLVCPYDHVATIAFLPDPLPQAATYISAICSTRHEEAPLVEYAMAVVPPGVAAEAVFDGDDEQAEGFSGWQALSPKATKRLSMILRRIASPGARLHLATRIGESSSARFAFATWSDFEIGINGELPADIDQSLGDADGGKVSDLKLDPLKRRKRREARSYAPIQQKA